MNYKANKGSFQKGHIPWTKGLTKETDPRLMRISEFTANRVRGENNPMKKSEVAAKVHNPETYKKVRQSLNTPESKAKRRANNAMNSFEVREKQKQRAKEAANRPAVKEKQRQRMLCGHAAFMSSRIKNPSKEQVKLYEKVKTLYPTAILNYQYKNYSIDVAVVELKIAIEFDGYYHWLPGRQEADRIRQTEIEKGGWQFLRYTKIPNDNDLLKAIQEMKSNNQ